MAELEQALRQLKQIESFCNLCDRIPMPPVTLPPDPVRAAGLDPEIWHGLGIVGLWAAIDAFRERRKRKGPLPNNLGRIWKELDDMRHLYAHNFAGVADATYFKKRQRNYFQSGIPYNLASGNIFDGHKLILTLDDLKFYIKGARDILNLF
jgi:hypothetical protein